MGGEVQAMAEGNKNNWTLKRHVTWGSPTHSNPYSQPCVRKTSFASFVPQPAENHTSYFFLSNVSQLLFVSASVYWGEYILGSIHNLSRGWAMMISLFFLFVFLKPPPPPYNLRGFFLTPTQEMLIYHRKISWPPLLQHISTTCQTHP